MCTNVVTMHWSSPVSIIFEFEKIVIFQMCCKKCCACLYHVGNLELPTCYHAHPPWWRKLGALCLQTSRHERDEAEQKLSKMTSENADLVQRFHHMKSTEVERMNEVNRACEEMVCS